MTAIKGTNVAAPIVPFDTFDTFGTHDAQYGIGGYRSVNNIYERNAIPTERRSNGMRVRVIRDSIAANNVDWDYIDGGWVRSVTVQQAEAARDAAIAAKVQAETARDAAQLASGVYPNIELGLLGTAPGQYFNVPSDDNDEFVILYLNVDDITAQEIKRYPSAALVETLLYAVARTLYVTMDGDDNNSGTSLRVPLATVGKALQLAALFSAPCVVIVHPGEYLIEPDTVIPRDCALYGYDLRVTKLSLPSGAEENNMFLMSNGIKVRGFSFSNIRHEAPPNYATYTSIELGLSDTNAATLQREKYFLAPPDVESNELKLYFNNKGVADLIDYDYPPEKGWVFVFKPGEFITRSPYLGDCSNIHSFTYQQLTLPIDKKLGNPLMIRGGGNLLADGSVLSHNSPLRSVVVDSFTAINPNGYGYLITRGAIVQLVSVFTNWSRIGIWCHQGGQVTIANSNNTFGDYAFASTGYRHSVRIADQDPATITRGIHTSAANQLEEIADAVVESMHQRLLLDPTYGGLYTTFSETQYGYTKRDAHTLLLQLSYDLLSGSDRAVQFFIKGLFDWDAEPVFNMDYLDLFNYSFDIIAEELSLQGDQFTPPVMDTVRSLLSLVKTSLTSPPKVALASTIEANGQQLSHAGSGVNYNALPYTQRGTGSSSTDVFIKSGGGKIYATYATEIGDTYLGEDLRVDFERNTIEGQAFSRGVQNITLPLIIGVGG